MCKSLESGFSVPLYIIPLTILDLILLYRHKSEADLASLSIPTLVHLASHLAVSMGACLSVCLSDSNPPSMKYEVLDSYYYILLNGDPPSACIPPPSLDSIPLIHMSSYFFIGLICLFLLSVLHCTRQKSEIRLTSDSNISAIISCYKY